ncbi:MAG: hypothetical protein HZC24_00730 [Rhodocyclales bacterium]|nr:hypothetical protein [Rhodocyclales bacterium]
MKDFEASPPADDALDLALKAYARHFERARPSPEAVDAILSEDLYARFRRFVAANDGELDDEQLDAVAAAAQADFQWLLRMFRDKP